MIVSLSRIKVCDVAQPSNRAAGVGFVGFARGRKNWLRTPSARPPESARGERTGEGKSGSRALARGLHLCRGTVVRPGMLTWESEAGVALRDGRTVRDR